MAAKKTTKRTPKAKARKPAAKKTTKRPATTAPLPLDAGASARERVLAALRRGDKSVAELAASLGLEPKQVRGCIDGLRRAGVPVRALGKGRFSAR